MLVVFIALSLFLAFLAIRWIVIARDDAAVKKSSQRYDFAAKAFRGIELEKLKKSYVISKRLNSKYKLDNLDIERQVLSILSESSSIKNLVCTGVRNYERLNGFVNQMENAPEHPSEKESEQLSIPLNRYIKAEDRLISSFEKTIRDSIPKFTFEFSYTSPKGRNSYRRTVQVKIELLSYLVSLFNRTIEYRQTAQYQRSLVSVGLRYDIMQRDGFKCTICGRSAKDGVQLHVDHIQPISKGGKSEWNNLRTLCQDCNLGKKDKFSQTKPN